MTHLHDLADHVFGPVKTSTQDVEVQHIVNLHDVQGVAEDGSIVKFHGLVKAQSVVTLRIPTGIVGKVESTLVRVELLVTPDEDGKAFTVYSPLAPKADEPQRIEKSVMGQLVQTACFSADSVAIGFQGTSAEKTRAIINSALEALIANGMIQAVPIDQWPEYFMIDVSLPEPEDA